jgi:methyltransferase-like protein 6
MCVIFDPFAPSLDKVLRTTRVLSPQAKQGTNMAGCEFNTAASYYLLFASKNVVEEEAQKLDTPSSTTKYGRFECSSSKEEGNWEICEWTEQDDIDSEALLQQHLEKCTISSLDTDAHDESENWDKFYHDNGTRFFKDRHYFAKAFPNEFGAGLARNSTTLVELGCGVGNACLPLLEEEGSQWKTIHALDISAEAIALLRKDSRFIHCNKSTSITGRSILGHVCDISKFFPEPCIGVADVTTLIFCISALDPDDMPTAARHVASSLKPGGTLIVRDYGRYDEAQMKLGTSRNKRLKDNFYRKHDGTKCYYFSLEDLDRLFVDAGLEVMELYYLRRIYGNKGSGETRRRIWVQGRFSKPMEADDS